MVTHGPGPRFCPHPSGNQMQHAGTHQNKPSHDALLFLVAARSVSDLFGNRLELVAVVVICSLQWNRLAISRISAVIWTITI